MIARRALVATALTAALIGCGSDDPVTERLVSLEATEFSFSASEAITITAGDTIRFEVRNAGSLVHEMEVLTDANRRVGRTDRIAPGALGVATVTFDTPGVYTVICDIDDHRLQGQQSQFTVVAP